MAKKHDGFIICCVFFNDNTDNQDNGITVATEKLLLLLFLLSALSSKKPQAVFIYYREFSISRIIKKSVALRLTKTYINPLKRMWALPCCHASAFVL